MPDWFEQLAGIPLLVWLAVIAVLGGLAALSRLNVRWKQWRRSLLQLQLGRLRELFTADQQQLEADYLRLARSLDKPRGLLWQHLDWTDELIFARQRRDGHYVALRGVTVQFEAIPGGDMEEVAAVAEAKQACAVFVFDRGRWHASDKTLFNLLPREAVQKFASQYEPLCEP